MQDLFYSAKRISFGGDLVSILTQNANGPCPLLALFNILVLQRKIKLHPDLSGVSHEEVLALVADYLLQIKPPPRVDASTWEQHLQDILTILPSLSSGLDINISFDRCDGFEYTQQLELFDAFGIRVLHGWLYSPENKELASILKSSTYNQIMEKLVVWSQMANPPPEQDISQSQQMKQPTPLVFEGSSTQDMPEANMQIQGPRENCFDQSMIILDKDSYTEESETRKPDESNAQDVKRATASQKPPSPSARHIMMIGGNQETPDRSPEYVVVDQEQPLCEDQFEHLSLSLGDDTNTTDVGSGGHIESALADVEPKSLDKIGSPDTNLRPETKDSQESQAPSTNSHEADELLARIAYEG
eukprot:TRINITY_DN1146_c0_g1_i3.p1 TRINITY_DN1146_c0_g1~~TRINITY_DN1146_c0_g1_i3.p1  ORF type:complete len:359 (+),score=81.00 TRINITY_DN1146_c0_g1_i3:69-1145(+)